MKERMVQYVSDLQEKICVGLEQADTTAKFSTDKWERPGGGGGTTRALSNGTIFEKAGVNVSVVHGSLNNSIAKRMKVEASSFFATGISLVLHPWSPHIPTIHANFRYFENGESDAWFGGGIDLTPYTGAEWPGRHFHGVLNSACGSIDETLYPKFKMECDEYFYIKHRKEARGVGGIFYDYLRGTPEEMETHFAFQQKIGDAFLNSYLPIIEKYRNTPITDREREFQLLRRGRYAEFNLVYDRGTKFGLETDGRIESILMSLPATAKWEYNADMETTDSERALLSWLQNPREWV